MKIKINELKSKISAILRKNFSSKAAQLITDYLIWAEMSGIKTQGIIKLTGNTPLQDIKPKSKIRAKIGFFMGGPQWISFS